MSQISVDDAGVVVASGQMVIPFELLVARPPTGHERDLTLSMAELEEMGRWVFYIKGCSVA